MAVSERPVRVFLSYSHEDKDAARQLYEALRIETLDVWLDEVALVPGEPWQEKLLEALDDADAIVALIGENAAPSAVLQREVQEAVRQRERNPRFQVIPLLLPGSSQADIPYAIRSFPAIDLSQDTLGGDSFARVAARLAQEPDEGGPPGYEIVGDRRREAADPREARTYFQKALQEHVAQGYWEARPCTQRAGNRPSDRRSNSWTRPYRSFC